MARGLISLEEQVKAMRALWPGFEAVPGIGPGTVVWFGDLTGFERKFHLFIQYGLPLPGCREMCRLMPEVRVLRPRLVPNPDAAEEAPLPHVYFDLSDLAGSPLCLFDPRLHEWDASLLIARTTIPWAERWLWNYELWEATGEWHGGGTHPEPDKEKAYA